MAATEKGAYVLTPIGRVVFPHLFAPAVYRDADPDKKPTYEITLIFPKGTDLSGMKAIWKEALIGKFGQKPPKGLDNPFRPAGEKFEDVGYSDDDIYVKFKSQYAPEVIDRKKRPIDEASGRVYDGCWARLSCSAYAFDVRGNKGVAFNLGNVQIVKDDEPLEIGGGRPKADEEFDELDIEGEEDSLEELDDELI